MHRSLAILLLVAVSFWANGAGTASVGSADSQSFDTPVFAALESGAVVPARPLPCLCTPSEPSPTFVPVIDPIAGRVFDAARASPSTCPTGVSAAYPGFHQACGLSPLSPSELQCDVDLSIADYRGLDIERWQASAGEKLREWLCGNVMYIVVVRQSGPPTLIDVLWGILRFP